MCPGHAGLGRDSLFTALPRKLPVQGGRQVARQVPPSTPLLILLSHSPENRPQMPLSSPAPGSPAAASRSPRPRELGKDLRLGQLEMVPCLWSEWLAGLRRFRKARPQRKVNAGLGALGCRGRTTLLESPSAVPAHSHAGRPREEAHAGYTHPQGLPHGKPFLSPMERPL